MTTNSNDFTVLEKILYCILVAVRGLIRLLPLRFTLWAFSGIAKPLALLLPKERRIAICQLRFVAASETVSANPECKIAKIAASGQFNKLILDNIIHATKVVVESMNIDKLLRTKTKSGPFDCSQFLHIVYENEHLIKEHLATNQPCLILSGHIGCFELLAAYHVKVGLPITTIGRDSDNGAFAQLVADMRSGYGASTIWRSDTNAGGKLVKAIKNRSGLAFLIDQDTNLPNSFSPLFGLDAAHPEAPIKLGIRFKLPCYTSFIIREGAMQHRIISERVDYESSGTDAEQTILRIYNQRLEAVIAKYPEQWVWWHRRWRRRPGVNYDGQTVWPPKNRRLSQVA